MNIKKINKLSKLTKYFDLYKLLLTEKQQQLFELYYFKDYSLTEIASFHNVSRTSVYDILKTAERNLVDLENKLKLNEINEELIKLIDKIEDKKLRDDFFNLLKKY
ncbi:/ / putative helix-turn-helix protein, YlxM/p13 family protein / 505123:505437 Reverse [Candidatus Hepatoplasma crinochetorum]|uniref:UPF0122 protein HEPPS_02230 n=1 Tax=Candidatus Hepatoplasma crinochetorum TaxID=295596 RepID=A0A0G7ZN13_9MOLU|nr:/ / putative helix-turn-helix protein, YlxM/p13 family protein / 505123:505437 Reverse [Candidatus Hepatoplasma crinochetorum]